MVRAQLIKVLVASLLVTAACGDPSSDESTQTNVQQSTLLDDAAWSPFYARMSPDGELLAFMGYPVYAGPTIGIVRSGQVTATLKDPKLAASDFAWMPDSDRLLVSFGSGARHRLALFGTDGSLLREVPVDRPYATEISGIAVDPSGTTAILSAQDRGGTFGESDLLEVDLASGDSRYLTSTDDMSETWPVFINEDELAYVRGGLTWKDGSSFGEGVIWDRRTDRQRVVTPRGSSVIAMDVNDAGDVVFEENASKLFFAAAGSASPRPLGDLALGHPSFQPGSNDVVAMAPAPPGGTTRILLVRVD